MSTIKYDTSGVVGSIMQAHAMGLGWQGSKGDVADLVRRLESMVDAVYRVSPDARDAAVLAMGGSLSPMRSIYPGQRLRLLVDRGSDFPKGGIVYASAVALDSREYPLVSTHPDGGGLVIAVRRSDIEPA